MKKCRKLWILAILHFILASGFGSNEPEKTVPGKSHRSADYGLRVACTPELNTITTTWAAEFRKAHPEMAVLVTVIPSSPILEAGIQQDADLTFISNEGSGGNISGFPWSMQVASDVIVPVISRTNPWQGEICRRGISMDDLVRLAEHREKCTWGMLLGNGSQVAVHLYIPDDEPLQASVARFLQNGKSITGYKTVATSPKVVAVTGDDPYGIGFCYLRDALDPETRGFAGNVQLLPIDRNKNGGLDYFENIYGSSDAFLQGVLMGKYPKALCRNIFCIASQPTGSSLQVYFLRWVLLSGQPYVTLVGQSGSVRTERQRNKLELLASSQLRPDTSRGNSFYLSRLNDLSRFSIILVILVPLVLIAMGVEALVRARRNKAVSLRDTVVPVTASFNENTVLIPNGLYFDRAHTWVFMERHGSVRVGVDDFLSHVTGPLTRIIMKKPGENIRKGELLCTLVQQGKQLNICSPVTGTITANNDLLAHNASSLNDSPYSDGWVYLIEPADWCKEIRGLILGQAYRDWLKREVSRLKDFIAEFIKPPSPEVIPVVLQDGGELKEGILAELGPEVWDDFQTHFTDTSRA